MCRFRVKEKSYYKCIIRGRRCDVAPERRKVCESNMAKHALGVEIVTYYDPELKRFSFRVEGTIHGRLL